MAAVLVPLAAIPRAWFKHSDVSETAPHDVAPFLVRRSAVSTVF